MNTPPIQARYGVMFWCLFALILVALPLAFPGAYALSLLSQMGIAILACLSYQLLLGQGGLLSFGHAIFTGSGGYVVVHALVLATEGAHTWSAAWLVLLPVMGGLGAATLAALLGWLSTGRASTPFAMITLGLGELVWAASFMVPEVFGGEAGISVNRLMTQAVGPFSLGPQIQLYGLIAVYLLGGAWLLIAFTRTPLGLLLNASRDDATRVAYLGFNPRVVRYAAFITAGFFAGVAGGLSALNFEFISSDVFSLQRSGAYLLFTFIGGSSLFYGPVIGGVLMVAGLVWLSELTPGWLLYLGLLFVIVVMFVPGGLSGGVTRWWQIRVREGWWFVVRAGLGVCAALPPTLGTIMLIEMLYHHALVRDGGVATTMVRLGVSLDVAQAANWWLFICCTPVLFWLCRRAWAGLGLLGDQGSQTAPSAAARPDQGGQL